MNHILTGISHMITRLILILATSLPLIGHTLAAPIQMIFSSGTYQHGSPLLFSIVLPTNVGDLGAYEIQVVMTGETPTAGVDYEFDVGATEAANSQYVFDSTDQFFDTLGADSATSQILVLTDFTLGTGVGVAAGINDRVADVVVNTSADYTGSLVFSIDVVSLILDTPSGNEITTITAIRTATAVAAPTTLIVIPEPNVILALTTVVCLSRFRRRRVRRTNDRSFA